MSNGLNAQIAMSVSRLAELAEALLTESQALRLAVEATKRNPPDGLGGINFYEAVQKFEISLIKSALAQTSGNQTKAAQLLGLNTTTLNAKIKLFKIRL